MASGALALRWRPGLCSCGLLPRVAAAPPAGGRRWAAAPRPRGFCAEGAGPAGEAQAPGAAADAGPRVLWRARGLEKQFGEVQSALDTSAAVSAGGFWMALMGIAPFTPPNMFMVAMVLAIMQVRLAHTWLTRQLHSQARRHVLEVEQSSPYQSDGVAFTQLKLRCEGGLTRTLHLERAKTSGSMQASVGAHAACPFPVRLRCA
ncbi:unnamed protein product [Prorocentrum cordatum]|uniref:Uncharacterized protein n=1 Tax=Prorocentrum cordatum TaxID=2364126 RepID=A0ABN9QHD1_9DINO|nr:unnamed protein product [Polarella glacialis]